MRANEPLWLASRSPRRRELLAETGADVRIRPSDLDDGLLRPGSVEASNWVASLAYLKARRVADQLRADGELGTVLGADTVCVCGGVILGQPDDADHARAMLLGLVDREHVTLTGVCLYDLADGSWKWFTDRSLVRVGVIDAETIDAYVASGGWRGKAGGYNLQDRIDDGWPIECIGDPANVMGLPMLRLGPMLGRRG